MKCTYCGEEKEFNQKMEMTIKSTDSVWKCVGGECKRCGVSNFDYGIEDKTVSQVINMK